jgi:predicted ATPase
MKIERIAVQAYRSLYDVTLHPTQFTVLVGPNNAGKSNLVEALDFLGDVHRHGLEVAITRKGGFENLAHRRVRRTKRPIAFDVTVSFTERELDAHQPYVPEAVNLDADLESQPALRLRHRFEVASVADRVGADFQIAREEFDLSSVSPREEKLLVRVVRTPDSIDFTVEKRRAARRGGTRQPRNNLVDPFNDSDFQEFIERRAVPNDLLMRGFFFNFAAQAYSSGLSMTRLYQLAPIECRRPGVSTPNADIDLHGGNLPALVSYMQKNHPDAWTRVLQAMRRIVPDLTKVATDFTHDRRLTLQFAEEGVGRPWTSEDVSDGTIQSLALFSALYDPRSPLALIEEPENSVHPWIVRSFVDACREISYKQIFVTSHSPALLEYLRPTEVSLVWRRDGRTHVEPLVSVDPHAEELWAQGKSTVYELLDSGMLEVAVPGGFR